MSIYGNVTDMSRAHFQFDKIFSSRYEMDQACGNGTDGIFSGRFVLVKYDKNGTAFYGEEGYLKNNTSTTVYADQSCTIPYVFTTFSGPVNNPVSTNWGSYYYYSGEYYFKLPSEYHFNPQETNYYIADTSGEHLVSEGQIIRIRDSNGTLTNTYYKCIDGTNGSAAVFSPVILSQEYQDYFINYNIDRVNYKEAFDVRGYDATVWQKIYSGGNGKFILICYLNGEFPRIEFFADAPSEFPSQPFVDNKSTDSVYRLHLPTQWGFRIKEAEGEDDGNGNIVYTLSDESIIQNYPVYENNEYQGSTARSINADIYFNKNGFVKIQRTYDNSTQNEILITPTGESGKVYFDENGNQKTIDIYELSIHLPIIGNIITDFYDLLYGYDATTGARPLDTIWYNANDPRKNTGNPLLNGKTHDLNTAAGIINTLQDRLGQNIITLDSAITNTQAATLDKNYIYAVPQGDNQYLYYRIGVDYNYTPVPEYSALGHLSVDDYEPNKYYILSGNTYVLATSNYSSYNDDEVFYRKNITYASTTLTEEQYEPNTYYIQNNGQYVMATETYNYYPNNQVFWKKNISIFKFEEIELIGYTANTFYYQDSQQNYLKDMNALVPTYKSQPYYIISAVNEVEYTFDYSYRANYFYKKLTDTRYILADEAIPDPLITYYDISAASLSDGEKVLYQPNKYYYYASYENGEPVGSPILETNENITSGRIYYFIPLSARQEYIIVDGQIYIGYALDIENKRQINLFQPNASLSSIYIQQDNTYIPASEIEDLTVAYEYYSLTIDTVTNYFLPYEYYRKDTNNNYYLQGTWSGDPDMIYYKLVNLEPLAHPFYEGNKYYYNNGNIYLIDTAVSMTQGRTYYIGTTLYVYDDSSNRWPYGFEWQEQAIFVPASVTLATRIEVQKAFEISGINNGESSINGAILTFNNFAAFNDSDTRDHATLTGSVNAVNDLLQSVKTNLIPGRVLYVNDFGQIAVSSIKISDLQTLVANLSS